MKVFIAAVSFCASSLTLMGANKTPERLEAATAVFHEIMASPDKGIPSDLLEKASCAVIVPGMKKGAFIVGGEYGRGFVTCRKSGDGWSNPAAVRMEGGSFGLQIGGSETDVVALIMNENGMNKLMKSKFTLGADASVAAGPVGRTASADTDASMHAEILSWSRARGVFAGVSLDGATLRPDKDSNGELYGQKVETRDVIMGNYPAPDAARPLLAELNRYSPKEGAPANAERKEREQH